MKLVRLSESVWVNPEHVASVNSYTTRGARGLIRTVITFRSPLDTFQLTTEMGRNEVVRRLLTNDSLEPVYSNGKGKLINYD